MKIRAPILLGYSAVIVLLISACIAGGLATRGVGKHFDHAVHRVLPTLNALKDIRNEITRALAEGERHLNQIDRRPVPMDGGGEPATAALDAAFGRYNDLVRQYFSYEADRLASIAGRVKQFESALALLHETGSKQAYDDAVASAEVLSREVAVASAGELEEFEELSRQVVASISTQDGVIFAFCVLSILIAVWGGSLVLRNQRELEAQVAERMRDLADSLRRAEEASEQAARARSLVEATLDATDNGILVVDLAGSIASFNRRFTHMWHISDELLNSRDDRLVIDHILEQLVDPERFLNKVTSLYARPEASSRDTLYFRDGRVFARFSHPQRLGDEIIGRVWSFLDVSDQDQAEKRILQLSRTVSDELERSEQQRGLLVSLLGAIPDPVWMKDTEGRYLSCNAAFEALVGQPASRILGRVDHDLFPPALADSFRNDDSAASVSAVPIVLEAWVSYPGDGRQVFLETIKAAVRGTDGKILGVLGVARDVTQMRALVEQLEDARQAAQLSSEAKSAFLANMSHEIRTPINAIVGMAELCLGTPLTERQRNYLGKIKIASDSLLHIINDILDFSKIEAGKLEIEWIPFDLDGVFDQLSSIVALRAENKGIELTYDLIANNQVVLGDPLRLGQVLTNLVTNALKFSVGGNVVVTADTVDDEAGGRLLHFSVSDEGIGMSPEQLEQLFQPFSQADSSTTRRFGGTGLGLAISRHLVEMMGGRIWAESTLGKGSCFHFTVRFGIAGPDRRQGIAALGQLLAEQANRPVLVVDDSPIALRTLERLIAHLGLQVHTADSAQAALDRLAQPAMPDYLACLVDWRMPGVDGIETIRRLRAAMLARGKAVAPPMLLVTAYSNHDELHEIAHEIDGLLAKPVSARHLYVELARSLGVLAEAAPATEQRKPHGLQWSQFRQLDILLIEDVEINQEVILELLAGVGLSARTAANGAEALDEVAGKLPDVVLMDCQMPVMDGYEATRRLRENPATRQLPIIALTANALATDEAKCRAAGMNGYVSKPIRMDALFEQLQRCLPEQAAREVPPVPDAAAGKERLPQFPGIDMTLGMLHVGGRLPLMLRVLKKLRDNQGQNFAREFKAARAEADWPTCSNLAHSLKGVANTLGAIDLGRVAGQLQLAVDARDITQCDELFPVVVARLDHVVAGLANLEAIAETVNAPRPETV